MCKFDTKPKLFRIRMKLCACASLIKIAYLCRARMRLYEFHKNLKCVELECCIAACESLIKTLSVKN